MIACLSTDILFACTCDYVRDKCDFCVFLTNKNLSIHFMYVNLSEIISRFQTVRMVLINSEEVFKSHHSN
jgi:hypothetical protein